MNEEDLIIIEKSKVIDFFILIIEGKVEVNIGREELVFESGPFTYFGIQALHNVILDSPQSPNPQLASKTNLHQQESSNSLTGGQGHTGVKGSLRKASTQHAIEMTTVAPSGKI